MKKTLFYSTLILCVTLIIAVVPTEAEGAVYEDTVRLHILANSNSEEDQNLKLKIRDDVLLEFSDSLAEIESADKAKEALDGVLPEIELFVRDRLSEYGYDYDVKVTLTTEWYDTREYEEFTLPKGYYSSLRIILGEGEGNNWWCVMFPPLCLDIATEKAEDDDAVKKYSDSEFALISRRGYKAKFKILELASSVFS